MKRALFAAAITILAGCENPFSPRGPYTPRLVVYSVLSNTRSTQFVRISMTYDPPGAATTLPDSGLVGEDVRMTSNGVTYQFRDTVLSLEGTGEPVHAYVCDSLTVAHGGSYGLRVTTRSLGSAGSDIAVPTAPSVRRNDLTFSVGLSRNTGAYLIRFFVDFDTYAGSDTVRHRWEVPLATEDTSLSYAIYPGVELADRPSATVSFSNKSYVAVLTKIVHQYSVLVKWRDTAVEVCQIGQSLQTYSSVVNGFKDELSLRLDKPDYGNVTGGLGLFGVYTKDEVVYPYPPDFYFNPDPQN